MYLLLRSITKYGVFTVLLIVILIFWQQFPFARFHADKVMREIPQQVLPTETPQSVHQGDEIQQNRETPQGAGTPFKVQPLTSASAPPKTQPYTSNIRSSIPAVSEAITIGKRLSNGYCKGEGMAYKLSVLPMKPEDFSHIVPYGIMIGEHVTPVDHQYFSPIVFHAPKDTYEVRAMADSNIVGLEIHPPENGSNGRIRMIFSITCTYFYYYDLVTSIVPKISFKNLPVSVKAGEVIGRIGGQTLDFAVWDTTRAQKGFVSPERYASAEPWKIYTVDPLEYYTDDVKIVALSKYVRQVEPRSGKIDNDIDGRLIGNWFQEGTKGYGGLWGEGKGAYWEGHLAFAPDWYDPSVFYVSVGYLAPADGGQGNQFSVPRGSPNPAMVSVATGLIKYELRGHFSWKKIDGATWDNLSFASGGVTRDDTNTTFEGCALVEMLGSRTLKFETRLKEPCEDIQSFSANARIYTR